MYWRQFNFHRLVWKRIFYHSKRELVLTTFFVCSHKTDTHRFSKKSPFLYKKKKDVGKEADNTQCISSGATNFSPQVSTWGKKVPAKPRSERRAWRLNANGFVTGPGEGSDGKEKVLHAERKYK